VGLEAPVHRVELDNCVEHRGVEVTQTASHEGEPRRVVRHQIACPTGPSLEDDLHVAEGVSDLATRATGRRKVPPTGECGPSRLQHRSEGRRRQRRVADRESPEEVWPPCRGHDRDLTAERVPEDARGSTATLEERDDVVGVVRESVLTRRVARSAVTAEVRCIDMPSISECPDEILEVLPT
jgi:hypothetical protein